MAVLGHVDLALLHHDVVLCALLECLEMVLVSYVVHIDIDLGALDALWHVADVEGSLHRHALAVTNGRVRTSRLVSFSPSLELSI